MANIFISHRTQTAEASLQRSFEQSVRQLEGLTKQLMAWQSAQTEEEDFPKPDLNQMGVPPGIPVDVPPDSVKADLQSRTVAATAAVLTEAYGEGGQYQAEGYTIQSSPQDGGKTAYRVTEPHSQQVVFAFERDNEGVISVSENQLSAEQTQDFLQVAQHITQIGFASLDADATGKTQAKVLGRLAPLGHGKVVDASRRQPDALTKILQPDQQPVSAMDLVQWRYASIVLGCSQKQTEHITAMAQAAAKVTNQSFLQLYQQDRSAPLPLQPEAEVLPRMRQDIEQLKDLVWQIGPARVEQLYQMQRRLTQPIRITSNEQLRTTELQSVQSSQRGNRER